jgi:non-heme chloroperoxidase
MAERKLTPEEQDWILKESLQTPTYAALQLALDAIYADYRPEAKLLNSRNIPTLDFISQHWADHATQWLHTNAPNAKIKVMGKHLMFWEHPNEFNQTLDTFLDHLNRQ